MTLPRPRRARCVVLRQDDEAGGVVGGVLDVLLEDVEAVDLGGHGRGERGLGDVAGLGDLARGTGRIAGDDRLPAVLADDVAALAERMDVAVDGLDRLQRGALRRHELEVDGQEVLADDVQAANWAADGGYRRRGRRANSRSGSWRDRPCPSRPRRSNPRRSGREPPWPWDRPRGRRPRNWRRARPGKRSTSDLASAGSSLAADPLRPGFA